MRGTIVRIGATGAGALLALGLFAAQPAGADGSGGKGEASDTTCFTATGHTQGRSHSDPDGMSNGGADKPGCPGGFDADKDGNNGCGNDADREDDNKGNCGRRRARGRAAPSTTTTTANISVQPNIGASATMAASATAGATLATAASAATDTAVSGAGADSPPAAQVGSPVPASQTEVLGETQQRPSALVRTGLAIAGMVLLGGVLCGSGRLAVLARRLLRIG